MQSSSPTIPDLCSERRFRFCFLACLFALISLCWIPVQVHAAPQAYEKARAELDKLSRDAKKRQIREPWEDLAEAFLDVYEKEKNWTGRPAALYRSALALDELSRRSGIHKEGRQAEARYKRLVQRHKNSPLADDALYKAARLRAELLQDDAGARELLEQIRKDYPSGDQAQDAARYAAKLQPQSAAPVQKEKPKPVSEKRKKLPPLKLLPVRTVLLDAGHGGRDPGTRHNGVVERTITLDLAKRVGAILAAHGLAVRYTRFANDWVSLDERTDKVRTDKADLFVSVHVNANTETSIQGFETYYLDIARTSKASQLAAVENAMLGRSRDKVPAARLLGMQNQESRRLARDVHRNTLAYLQKKKQSIRDGGIKSAPFQVLRKAGVPGILIEVGYCTHPGEARNLASPAYRVLLARGIANGILDYADRRK